MHDMKSPDRKRRTLAAILPPALLLLFWPGSILPAQSRPRQIQVGYWHNWPAAPNTFRLGAVPAGYDVINVAFATPARPFTGTLRFVPDSRIYSSPQLFRQDLAALQAKGRKVLISVGGANHPIHLDKASDVTAFVNSLAGIVNSYGFDGIDIDLEGSSLTLKQGDTDFTNPTTPRIVNLIKALQQLRARFPAPFLLTFAPETAQVQGGYARYVGIWGAYLPVLHALRSQLTHVHVQHYNTGSMYGRNGRSWKPGTGDFHVAMADMLLAGFQVSGGKSFPPFSPDQVLLGVPAAAGAAGSGYTSPQVVHQSLDYLVLGKSFNGAYRLARPAGHLDFRGLMIWSINWDVKAGGTFGRSQRDHLDSLFLGANRDTISQQGGSASLSLRAGRGNALRRYLLLGTMSGTKPGIPLTPGGVVLPLNPDLFTSILLQYLNSPLFMGFLGTLDGNGEASALLNVPPIPGGAGARMDFAFLLHPAFDFTSDPTAIRIGP